jgi:2-oxoisovalerate dehydrogenase E2 component (dihydrolipoyl transacylase)
LSIENITMPQLGESVTEGTISKWLVAVGDHIDKYEPIAEVMTDKVTAEVPSSFTGTISELIAEEGDTLAVGEIICKMNVGNGAETEPVKKEYAPEGSTKINNEAPVNQDKSNKHRYSPAVLRLSQEHGINLEQLNGTGAGGRITRKDVLKAVETGNIPTPIAEKAPAQVEQVAKAITVPAPPPKPTPAPRQPLQVGDVEVPVTPVRKAIASNMLRSKHEIPHAWTMVEVDVTNLVNYRNEVKDDFKKKEGINLTFFSFFIKAIAQALAEFPEINSTWAGENIIRKKDINISIAVATDDALFVPVIKNADERSIKGIAREITDLARKVRTGTITPDDMQGGTFTVNNTGSFGSIQSIGIINYPQAGILQVETIVKRPVIIDGMIAVRDMVNLCMSLDHRVLDGLVCGRFLARIKEILEKTSRDTTSIY